MSAPVHVAHETGAWNLAVAAAFVAVAAAPAAGRRRAAVPRHLRRAPGAGHAGRPRRRARARRPGRRPPAAPRRRGRWWRPSPGAGVAGARAARGARGRGCPREACGPLRPARPARRLAARRRRHGRPGRRARRRWSPPTRRRAPALEQAPAAVTLEFSEGVSLGAGYARVLVTSDGERSTPATASVDGGVLTIPLRGELPDDGYLVTYRVISADSHPISGAFSFVVGDGELVPAGAAADQDRTDPVVAAALPLARWVGFAGLALAIGVPVLALVCWPAGWASAPAAPAGDGGEPSRSPSPRSAASCCRARTPRRTGLGAAVRPVAAGAPRPASEAGWALLARARAGARARPRAAAGRGAAATPPSTARVVVGGLLAAGLVVSTAAIGHPVAGPVAGLAVAVTAVHVAAMAVWLGGLAGLLAAVLRPADARGRRRPRSLPRFSRLAFGAVAALVVSGTVQAVREVGSPTALFVTTYGWVLVAKLVLVARRCSAAAGVSRVWVQQRLGRPPAAARRPAQPHGARLRRVGAGERAAGRGRRRRPRPRAARAVGERGRARARPCAGRCSSRSPSPPWSWCCRPCSSAPPPARSAVAQPVDVLLPLQGSAGPSGSVQVSVDPARPGANTLHVYLFDDAGRLTQPAGITVSLTEPSAGASARWTSSCEPGRAGPLRRRRDGHPGRRHLDPRRERPARRVHRHHGAAPISPCADRHVRTDPDEQEFRVPAPPRVPSSPSSPLAALTALVAAATGRRVRPRHRLLLGRRRRAASGS